MRPSTLLRESRLMHVAVGASILAGPASAVALADTTPTMHAWLKAGKLAYGRDVVLTGHAPSGQAGQPVLLEFAPAGTGGWRPIASSRVGGNGSFRLAAPLTRSGAVRAVEEPQSSGSSTGAFAVAASSAGSPTTPAQQVSVAPALRIRSRAINVVGGQRVSVRGKLLPGAPSRRVILQTWRAGRWITVAGARTGARGSFALRYLPDGSGQEPLRVHFTGDVANAAASRRVGELTVFHPSLASWYDDSGTTACGFHAYYGVANLSLPCGARVSFMSGGRTVNAVVDDRGPYVGGRQWDLNQNTAAALGFAGVGTVWSSS
jgi:rare lipoprotein A